MVIGGGVTVLRLVDLLTMVVTGAVLPSLVGGISPKSPGVDQDQGLGTERKSGGLVASPESRGDVLQRGLRCAGIQ